MMALIKKHRNLFLFFVLIAAIGVTYFVEEKGTMKQQKSEEMEILNSEKLGELKSVKGIKIDMQKSDGKFYSRENQVPMRQERLDEFFQILSGVKVKSIINEADVSKVGRNFYIDDAALKLTFSFERGEITFSLGKKLSYDQSFYMEITRDHKTQMVIAVDESPDPGVYKTDQEYQKSDLKYKRLQMIFMLTNAYFYDTRLFKGLYTDPKVINFEEMTIMTFRNKKYSINFKNTTTNPPAPKALGYFEENWISFHRALTNLEGKTVIAPYEESALSEILSQFEIRDRDGRQITLRVYKRFGELNGYFLTSSQDKMLYVLKPEDSRFFFVNVQDFWKKNIAPQAKNYNLTLTFFDGKSETVNIEDKELFKVNGSKVNNPLEFKKLIEFLKMEGDHVSDVTEKPSEILKKKIMTVGFENRALNVILEDNDAVLVDLEARVKIHHYVGATLPFSTKRADYFK